MVRKPSLSSVLALAPLGLLALSGAAQASFTPIQCSPCYSYTSVDWHWNTSNQYLGEIERDTTCGSDSCPNYANNLDINYAVVANGYVQRFRFYTASRDIENNYDWLSVTNWDTLSETRITGASTSGLWTNLDLTWAGSTMRFVSDDSVTRPGFNISTANVCCRSSFQSYATDIGFDLPAHGVLLGTNDVVYLRAQMDNRSVHRSITVRSPQTGVDFDVYARCGAYPTPTEYDWRGYSSDAAEAIHIPAMPASCNSDMLYIAVNSFAGKGEFYLQLSEHVPQRHLSNVRAGTSFNASATDLARMEALLRSSAKLFYGNTEGAVFVENFWLYNSNGCNNCGGQACTICFQNQSGRSTAARCNGLAVSGQVNVKNTCWNNDNTIDQTRVLTHEYGHYWFCQPDEYNTTTGDHYCGHSLMSNYNDNLCTAGNHNRDGEPGVSPPSTVSAWELALNLGITSMDFPPITPEIYNYFDHDMNGIVGSVVRK